MTRLDPLAFKALIFDCDGVILDSNRIKSEAFAFAARSVGAPEHCVAELVAYHREYGGVSRYRKFRHFVQAVWTPPGDRTEDEAFDALCRAYAAFVQERLLVCEEADRLREILSRASSRCRLFVCSGGDEAELNTIFSRRKLDVYFDGIFGSPRTKPEILSEMDARGDLLRPALFIGDAKYDFEVAQKFSLDFAFVHRWTEFLDFENYFSDKRATVAIDLRDLFEAG